MLKLSKINPLVRAIGTMGAIAALVGGITFAALQSNTVALSPNNISTGSAGLQIASKTGDTCGDFSSTPVPGFNVSGLTSSSKVSPIDFCLKNSGQVPLSIFGSIPQNVTTATASGYINLSINCTTIGNQSTTLNSWYISGKTFTDNPLAPGSTASCTASISLSSSYPGSGGETVPQFDIQFVGNQS